MKTALIFDLETTGISAETDRIVEIGLALYSLEHHSLVDCLSSVVDSGIGNAAEDVNGIPAALVAAGISSARAIEVIRVWIERADVVLGHNATEFDALFLPEDIRALRPIVDTCHDVPWPRPPQGRSLTALALAHGVGVMRAHRALDDVLTIAAVLERSFEILGPERFAAMLAKAQEPKARYVALVSYDDRQKAKDHRFQWLAERKEWWRNMRSEDAAALPFPVEARP